MCQGCAGIRASSAALIHREGCSSAPGRSAGTVPAGRATLATFENRYIRIGSRDVSASDIQKGVKDRRANHGARPPWIRRSALRGADRRRKPLDDPRYRHEQTRLDQSPVSERRCRQTASLLRGRQTVVRRAVGSGDNWNVVVAVKRERLPRPGQPAVSNRDATRER